MNVTVLGSSSALPTSERFPSAHVLNAHERLFLIDCGEGTQMQLRKNKIRFNKINNIFISHLHGDHVFGLYGLLSSFSLMGRVASINIFAPGSFREIMSSHLNDFDIHLNYEVNFFPLPENKNETIFDDKYLTVSSFPLKHRVPAFGFLFREKPAQRNIIKECIEKFNIPGVRIPAIKNGEDFITDNGSTIRNQDITIAPPEPLSYAYCSDTRYFKKLAIYIKGVDVLYHEATFDKSLQKLAKITGHSTASDAATTAKDAGAGKLIIGHFSARYKDIYPLVDEAKVIFTNTVPAIDGHIYDIVKI